MLNLLTPQGFLNDAIVGVNGVYAYYWLNVLYALKHRHISSENFSNTQLKELFRKAENRKFATNFIVQITTKGGATHAIKPGIDNVLEAVEKYPILKKHVAIAIITELQSDRDFLVKTFPTPKIPIEVTILPVDYETKNKTKLKARALHYLIEKTGKEASNKTYLVHYDEESVFTPDNFIRLVANLLKHPKKITAGSISYGIDWQKANLLCRAMESNRPFGCHECFSIMKNPPIYHLHGSNLVIRQDVERKIGWDIGQYKNAPLIAEDLIFGLAAYARFGKKAFGWHYAEMIEQPPFTVAAAIKQRERWTFGALQGIAQLKHTKHWKRLSLFDKVRIQTIITARISSFFLGFPISLASFAFDGYLFAQIVTGHYSYSPVDILAVPGILMWLGAIQLGLFYNIRYANMQKKQKLLEHLKVLAITPFAGFVETFGAVLAVSKWVIGKRNIVWVPTPKSVTITPALAIK